MRRISRLALAEAVLPLLFLLTAVDDCQPLDPVATPTPAASRSVTPFDSPDSGIPPNLTLATVTRIIDGDTIEVSIHGTTYKLRYIGIDTPESVDPRRPVECFGVESSERNGQLVLGQTVGLEKDVSETDRFGRLLRYLWLDGRMINAQLVDEGYALASTYPPDVRYAAHFATLQAHAREAGRGLWSAACTPATASRAAASSCDYSATGEPLIKGNISVRTGEKIYHVPGGEFYEETVIDPAKGERWFCMETEALAAGWRRSLR